MPSLKVPASVQTAEFIDADNHPIILAPVSGHLTKCLVILRMSSDRSLLAITLEETEKVTAFREVFIDESDLCVSFGSDWILEIPKNANYTFDIAKQMLPGAISLTHNGPSIFYTSNRQDGSPNLLRLNDFRRAATSIENATVSDWFIWTDDEHLKDKESHPLISHTLPWQDR